MNSTSSTVFQCFLATPEEPEIECCYDKKAKKLIIVLDVENENETQVILIEPRDSDHVVDLNK